MSDQYKVTQIHAGSALWFVEDATGGVVAFCYSKDRATLVVHALDAYTSGSDVTETGAGVRESTSVQDTIER